MQEQRLPVGIDQQLVREWVSYQLSKRGPVRCNLVAIMGDELRLRMEGDGVLHVGYQNIRGSEMFSGLEVAPKLTVMLWHRGGYTGHIRDQQAMGGR